MRMELVKLSHNPLHLLYLRVWQVVPEKPLVHWHRFACALKTPPLRQVVAERHKIILSYMVRGNLVKG